MAEWSEWIIEFLAEHGLGVPARGELVVESEVLADPDAVRDKLWAFGGEGWVCFTDRVEESVAAGELPDGMPLSAELVAGDASLHLRQAPDGWALYTIRKGNGTGQLIFHEQRLRIGGGKINYEVAWSRAADGDPWQQYCSRFAGFEGK